MSDDSLLARIHASTDRIAALTRDSSIRSAAETVKPKGWWARLRLFFAGPPEPPPWVPLCPEAKAELRLAQSVCWSYERFRYHLDRAQALERAYQSRKARAAL